MILAFLALLVLTALLVLAFLAGNRFGYVRAERDWAVNELREFRRG